MTSDAPDFDYSGAAGSTRGAFAAGEALLLTGVAVAGVALLLSAQFCADAFLGCNDSSSPSGAAIVVLLLGAAIAAFGAPVMAARRSHGAAWRRPAALAVGASLLALAAGGVLFQGLVDTAMPGIGLALGVQGMLAVRSPSPRAMQARALVVGTFVLLEALVGSAAIVLLLLTYPALAFADGHASSLDRL